MTQQRYADALAVRVGRRLSMTEIANLAGAPPGAHVELGVGAQITVRPRDGSYTHTVSTLSPHAEFGAGPGLMNWVFRDRAGTNKQNFPASVLAMQARQARALGFTYITTKSRSMSRDAQRLPHLGYDAPIDAHLLTETRSKSLPAGVRGRLLSDVLATAAGRNWWRDNGQNPSLYFDLRSGSRSLRTLNRYLASHGQPPIA